MAKSLEIAWQVDLQVDTKNLDEFRALTSAMVEATAQEEGVEIYERYLDSVTGDVIIYERYASSEAAVAHLKRFQESFGLEFGKLVSRRRFLVFGDPSDELQELLSGFGARFCRTLGGFPLSI